jgi:serine/threonine protein kinase
MAAPGHSDAGAAIVDADKQLFLQREKVKLSVPGYSHVPLEADGYLGGSGSAVVYLVEEEKPPPEFIKEASAWQPALLPWLRTLKMARPYQLQQRMHGDSFQTTKKQYLDECHAALRLEQELLEKAESCPNIGGSSQLGWVDVRGHGYLPALLLEYSPGGSLEQFMQAAGGALSYECSQRFMIDVCQALCFLHTQGICCQEVQPSSLLVYGMSGQEHLKLAILGCARKWRQEDGKHTTLWQERVCAAAYESPEARAGGWQNYYVDGWAAGSLLLHMRTGEPPWEYMRKLGREDGRGAAELDNPASPYYTLETLEKAVLRDCLAEVPFRPPLSVIVSRHPEYFTLTSL